MNDLTIRAESNIEAKEITASLFSKWIAYVDAMPKTVETYTRAIKQFFSFMQRHGITQPQRADILAYKEELQQNHKPTTITSYLQAVKLFFQWTEQEGLYPDIAKHVKGAKLDTAHKKDYLTSKQAKKVLDSIDRTTLQGKRDYAIIALMLTSGLRTISVIRANIEDIRTAGDDSVLYYQGKGHEEKTAAIILQAETDEAIREYLAARGKAEPQAPLFGSLDHKDIGGRLTTKSISRLVKQHLVTAGFNSERYTAHSLRHTAATLNLLNGATLEETAGLLGHANINTTRIYSHALEAQRNRSTERIGRAIFG